MVAIANPVVFPAKIPVLLAQGTEGIAPGMTTRVLSHNLIELLQAQVAYLQGEDFQVFPDFATGGFVDVAEYADGNGKVLVRAKLDTKKFQTHCRARIAFWLYV